MFKCRPMSQCHILSVRMVLQIWGDHEFSKTILRVFSVPSTYLFESNSPEIRLNLLMAQFKHEYIGIWSFVEPVPIRWCLHAVGDVFIYQNEFLISHFLFRFRLFLPQKRSHEARSSMSNMQIECSCGLRRPNVQMPGQTEVITTTEKYIGNCKPRRWFGWKWVFCCPHLPSAWGNAHFVYDSSIFCACDFMCCPTVVCWITTITKERFFRPKLTHWSHWLQIPTNIPLERLNKLELKTLC